jgi:intein-encoded DNA endonuclease-like protein
MTLTKDTIETISSRLKALPPVPLEKQTFTKEEALKLLTKDIKDLQKKGYSLDQISEALKNEKIKISKNHLRAFLEKKANSKMKTKRDSKRIKKTVLKVKKHTSS